MDSIFTRRSVRQYLDRAVEEEKIDKMLRAAMQAPSAGNQQPWEIIVVQDKETLVKLSTTSPYGGMLAKAPLAFVFVAKLEGLRFKEMMEQDMSACIENLLLQGADLGIGTVWLGIFPIQERMDNISNLLGIPKDCVPFAVVSAGYPKGNDIKYIDRYQENKVHFNKW